ncbi:MAG: exo-alpha-sialidase, partial [Opitutales bacterium]|nr:exo-alpha-sialidase [Opitutales bacterium]
MDTILNIINTRLLCGLILFSVYFPIVWADHHKFPSVAKVEQGGLLVSEQIFPIANKPTKECHASTIVEISGGKLVAAWFAGTRERDPDVGIWVSRKAGERWTEPVEVV